MGKKTKSFFNRLNSIEIKFDYSGKSPLSGKKLYLFAFFIPVIILFISFMIFGIYPAGDKTVLFLDVSDQYINFYENFRDAFWGNGSLVNSWSRNLSGETMGIFAYYLASPFIIILLLLPRSIITESLLIILLLKTGTASVTFCYYLRHSRQAYDNTSLIFSMLYSLMAYTITELMNPMWLDGIIYFPLICLGIEKLVDSGRCLTFIIPLTLMFIANFYIGWMVALSCCLYFIVYYFFISDNRCSFKKYDVFPKGVRFALSGILAAVCAAWVLIPVYCSLSLGKLSYTSPDYYSFKVQFDFADFFVNMLPNVYDTIQPGGSPAVFCGVLTLIMIPLFFFNNSIELRKKIGYGIIAAVMVFSMYSYVIDIIWHGFQEPNFFPYRYSFILSFFLLVMAAKEFDRIDAISYEKIAIVLFLLLGYVFYIDKQHIVISSMEEYYEKTNLYGAILFAAVMIVIYISLMYFHKKHYKVKPVPLIVTFAVIAELIVTSSYTMYKIENDVVVESHKTYKEYVELGRDTVSKIYNMDDGVYRIEKNFSRSTNDAMAFGSFGITHSSSTLNSDPIKFLHNLGFSYGKYRIRYKGATYVTDAVLGIKYVMEKKDILSEETAESENNAAGDYFEKYLAVMDGTYYEREEAQHYYDEVLSAGNNEEVIYVYENPYALPIGFMADSSIAELKLPDWHDPFENQNMLLSSLLSDEIQDFFVRIDIDDISMDDNVKRDIFDAHDRYKSTVENTRGNVNFTFTAPNDEMIYMFLPSDYERDICLYINGDIFARYYGKDYMTLLTLGRFDPGEEVTLTASMVSGEVMFLDKYFFYLDEEKFADAIDKLRQHPLEIESFKEDHLTGTVTAEKDGILFTSITYEPGWSIYVDGVKTEPVKLVDALIGIPVTEGTHTIEMKFFPNGLAPGIVISVIGIVAVILLGIYEHKKYSVRQ